MANLYGKCPRFCGNQIVLQTSSEHKCGKELTRLLKKKYRVRPYSPGGKTKMRTDNTHHAKKYRKATTKKRSRRRAYGPW